MKKAMLVAAMVSALAGCAGESTSESNEVQDLTSSSYDIHWMPKSEASWKFESIVDSFQASGAWLPEELLEASTLDDLREGTAVSFTQKLTDVAGTPPRNMAVEITMKVNPIPYSELIATIPAERWGVELAHYLGGEVIVTAKDSEGRATRQVERMVLSALPCDFSVDLLNNDMTKLEIIRYDATSARVVWRVMHSDNNSTEADVGSVEFRAYSDAETLVTFHSAHRVNALGGIHIPSFVVGPALRSNFLDHVNHYADLVQ